jgi:hypothetical protein
MAWLGHAIHVFVAGSKKNVDGRPSPAKTVGAPEGPGRLCPQSSDRTRVRHIIPAV